MYKLFKDGANNSEGLIEKNTQKTVTRKER